MRVSVYGSICEWEYLCMGVSVYGSMGVCIYVLMHSCHSNFLRRDYLRGLVDQHTMTGHVSIM